MTRLVAEMMPSVSNKLLEGTKNVIKNAIMATLVDNLAPILILNIATNAVKSLRALCGFWEILFSQKSTLS